jgi:multicomponent Na+:H+ antiporter subunit D
MGGLYGATSLVAILFFCLMLAAVGVPPFLGFWPKLMVLQAALAGGASAEWPDLVLAGAVLLNAFLTLIAGSRLWAHIFWRPGREGSTSEESGIVLHRLSQRQRWLGTGAAAVLTAIIAAAGLWPEPLVSAGTTAAVDLLDPQRYIEAVGLEERAP